MGPLHFIEKKKGEKTPGSPPGSVRVPCGWKPEEWGGLLGCGELVQAIYFFVLGERGEGSLIGGGKDDSLLEKTHGVIYIFVQMRYIIMSFFVSFY